MIFDTNFIIDIMRNDQKAINKLKEIEKKEPWGITCLTFFEIWSGIMQSDHPKKEKEKMMKVLKSNPIIELDEKSAEIAGKIEADLIKKGQKIENIDCMIAGISIQGNETLLTGNKKHFSRIKNLKIETY